MPRVPDTPCSICGELMWSNREYPRGTPGRVCQQCRRVRGAIGGRAEHGNRYGYKTMRCRCDDCRAWKAREIREYASRRRAEGVNIFHVYRQRPTRSDWIRPAERLAVYERDGWTCQLCGGSVDPSLDPQHRWAATLDHVKPRSLELFPDHSSSNLRLAHRTCNSRRGAPAA